MQTHGPFMGVASLTWAILETKTRKCSKWPIRENFHPWKLPTIW